MCIGLSIDSPDQHVAHTMKVLPGMYKPTAIVTVSCTASQEVFQASVLCSTLPCARTAWNLKWNPNAPIVDLLFPLVEITFIPQFSYFWSISFGSITN